MPTPNPYQPITPKPKTELFSATGSAAGVVYVVDAYEFKLGAVVNITGTALPTLRCTIADIDLTVTPHEITVDDGDGVAPDLSSYTVAAGSAITQLQEKVHQPRLQVDIDAQTTPLVISGTVAATGGLTDAELRASPVDVAIPQTSLDDIAFPYNMPVRIGLITAPSASRNNGTTAVTFALVDKIQLLSDVAVYVKFGTDDTVAATSANYDTILQAGVEYPVDMKSTYTHVAVLAVVTGTANVVVSSLES